jgi:hypothetical protein
MRPLSTWRQANWSDVSGAAVRAAAGCSFFPPFYVFFLFVSFTIGLTLFATLCQQDPTQFLDIGIITGIENNNKPVENARRGQEVCVKIENPGEGAPKMYGRHFFETDMLLSKVKFKCNNLLIKITIR